MPHADTHAMTQHLAEISANVAAGAHALVVADQAGWHGAEALTVPDNITLMPLPTASPELNPQENVWEWLRKNKLALRVFESYDQIVEACCQAWNDFIADADRVRSVTSREWAKAVNI
jgi:transposase